MAVPSTSPFPIRNEGLTSFPDVNIQIHGEDGSGFTSNYFTVMKYCVAFRTVVSVGGLVGNVLNIRAFLRMGLEDSVTIVFFNLAISDLFALLMTFANVLYTLCEFAEEDMGVYFELKPMYIGLFILIVAKIFNGTGALLTAFLAVQRCLCVTLPLRFKGMFTRLKTVVIAAVMWGYSLIYVFICSQFQLKRVVHNGTATYVMIISPKQNAIVKYIDIINGLALTITTQVLVLICVFIMTHALKRSIQFRLKTSSSGGVVAADEYKQRGVASSKIDVKGGLSKPNVAGNTSKERQALIQVYVLSTVFLCTKVPYFLVVGACLIEPELSVSYVLVVGACLIEPELSVSYFLVVGACQIEPELSVFGRYRYIYNSLYEVRYSIEVINMAINFLVYYKYNTKFRQVCFKTKTSS